MTLLTVIACVAVGVAHGACQAEVLDGTQVIASYTRHDWATDLWIGFAANIVASEARGVPAADLAIACTLVRDVERGWHPWELRRRWFGYGAPDWKDRAAVVQAVSGGCDDIPHFKYVGNLNDLRHWQAVGMVGDGPFTLYIGPTGGAVVGVPFE